MMQLKSRTKPGSMKRLIFDLIEKHNGLTDEEMWNIYGGGANAPGKSSGLRRTRSYMVKEGLLQDSGKKRPSSITGKMVTVWTIGGSTTNHRSAAACRTVTAMQLIERIHVHLRMLSSHQYTLSESDRAKITAILQKHLATHSRRTD